MSGKQMEVNVLAVEMRVGQIQRQLDAIKTDVAASQYEHWRVLDEAKIAALEAELEVLTEWIDEQDHG
jgi:hypothetical protein